MLFKRSVLFVSLVLTVFISYGQKLKKSEVLIVDNLKATISFLADNKLEGRRTGTAGEKEAATYIEKQFQTIGLTPKGENGTYYQYFTVDDGRQLLDATKLSINDNKIDTSDFFPLTFSSEGTIEAVVSPSIQEEGAPWFYDINELLKESANNPHADISEAIKKQVKIFQKRGANSVIIYNSGNEGSDLFYNPRSKEERLTLPVIFIKNNIAHKYLAENDEFVSVSFTVATAQKSRTGVNVIGYLDNGGAHTIIIGGHYDHLGYGEDRNSLWTQKPEIHNGADDNASGTALVIEMARLLKTSKYKRNNYLFICFSGEELGLLGSKYFTEHPTIPLSTVNYMINNDMVGRLNDETKGITVGGYGTSPQWASLPEKTKTLNIRFDSSGVGPSDHTSFYLKDIPVLFFFTGTHTDYHKPTDDADKINYIGEMHIIQYILDIIKRTDKVGKLQFTKTKEPAASDTPRFTVSLGVIPDYASGGLGLKIDGVTSDRPAEKAGLKAGDVITALGDFKIHDINDYMKALSHFKKGDSTTVTYTRGEETKTVEIEF
ncbi:MAG: M20/M25/M40 family metallo-hydrolase [Chitinophagaceae bacterium]|nr:M20/M25/M40 family metallo-hydrolase [Chitinophagaceae bacterium]